MPQMTNIRANTIRIAAGGGAFALPRLTLGVFRNDQPTHRIAVGSDRRKAIPLVCNQGWIMPASCEGLCEYDSDLDITMVEFDGVLLQNVGLDQADPALQRVGGHDPLILQFALVMGSFAMGDRLYRQTMEQAFAAHLAQTLRPQREELARVEDRRLRRVVDYIHDHLADDISLDDLAGLAAMSPFHFARTFKAANGISPLQYVIAARIERARLLLKSSRLSVAEIAHRVGYDDLSRFGQHFKRHVGMTPGAWRAG
jgi:AraC family transcriptional regulator